LLITLSRVHCLLAALDIPRVVAKKTITIAVANLHIVASLFCSPPKVHDAITLSNASMIGTQRALREA
jgi:hypothetical protein